MKFIDDPSLNGELVEASVDKLLLVEKAGYVDGERSKRASGVYDPFFRAIHGELSGLEDLLRRRD